MEMIVWCVFEIEPWEGQYLHSIWSTHELATVEKDRLVAKYGPSRGWEIEDWTIDEIKTI